MKTKQEIESLIERNPNIDILLEDATCDLKDSAFSGVFMHYMHQYKQYEITCLFMSVMFKQFADVYITYDIDEALTVWDSILPLWVR